LSSSIFLLGGTGFIGREVVAEALGAGIEVRALARSDSSEAALRAAGATPVRAGVDDVDRWREQARGAGALIDLVQPAFPRRLGRRAVARLAEQRLATTRSVLDALGSLPAEDRPLLLFVSGADDLLPEESGAVSERSELGTGEHSLSAIGVPVRRLIEGSDVEATFVYFGAMVYGAGKVFADVFVDGFKKHRTRVLGGGDNRLPLTHVTDAARALVHIAGLPRSQTAGRTFVAADGSDTTQRELLDLTAAGMGRKSPGSIPARIAALVAGGPAVETMTIDLRADPSALVETGFEFRYPTPRTGVPQALEQLGELRQTI
jgi:nucleoside-diphosphate-sugar epimerase